MVEMGPSTLSSIHETCYSTFNQMQADIDTLHAHCYDRSRQEKAESTRLRTMEKMIERRRAFKLARNHRRLAKEHFALQLQVTRNSDEDMQRNEEQGKEEQSRKWQRPRLTVEATSDKQEAMAHNHYLCGTKGRTKRICKQEERLRVNSPAKKIFRLNRRLWVDQSEGPVMP